MLVFSGDADSPPYSFMDGNKPAGFSIDLVEAISVLLKKDVNFELGIPREYTTLLAKGEIDGVAGMPVIEELKKHILFSAPLKKLDCAIFVLQTNDYVRDLQSLEGTMVAMHHGSIYLCPMKQANLKIGIMETDTVIEAFQKLKEGEVTAVICEKNVAIYHLNKENISGVKIVGPPVGSGHKYAIALKRDEKDLLSDINRAIKLLENNGILDNLKRKWFGITLLQPFPWKKVSMVTGIITGIMMFLMAGLWVTSLNAAVKLKTNHIQMLSEKIQEKDKLAVLGKLAGQIAHELRTPLSIISNSIYLLKREGTQDPELYNKRMDLLEDKVRLTSNILESILSYSRVKAEIATTISVPECLEEVIKDIDFPPNITYEKQIETPEQLNVFIDFHQLYSVLRNIITNSLQAMRKGGTLSVYTGLDRNDDYIIVRTSDTGPGLSGITPGHIFDLFSSTKITGTGLGLPISKSIIETNGGTLYLESTSKEGTVFVIRLPSAKKAKNKFDHEKKT